MYSLPGGTCEVIGSLWQEDAVQSLRQYFVDTVFVGVSRFDAEQGLSCFNPEEAALNAAMVERAKRRIVVAGP